MNHHEETTHITLVELVQNRADYFAAAARLRRGNTVTTETNDSFLPPDEGGSRFVRVNVTDARGRATNVSWIVPLDARFADRGVAFFGYAHETDGSSGRVSERRACERTFADIGDWRPAPFTFTV